ncbi:uncharacterized protein BO97DRAFT_233302 [Aspergillus homomorphus CBS 101889]|uniref:C2H2-type domain-containing protein n=1 Tax=Aspergillus homomorphus (strain CBS 101889) TaxID=1450537 RepID=A0A395HIQ0_ASPHC|nr:hypothetical protein BO97DRAFT_233302 [Aspergillus homomorphus CBS 101889]RAL07802.1 hypothetical protein BO97DRAFT_233302 [Aspergillus homomorphus CBS 101889]
MQQPTTIKSEGEPEYGISTCEPHPPHHPANPPSPPQQSAQTPAHRFPLSYRKKDDQFECTVTIDGRVCRRRFSSERSLRAHHRGLHDKTTDPCPFCGQRFFGQFSQNLHLRTAHGYKEFGVDGYGKGEVDEEMKLLREVSHGHGFTDVLARSGFVQTQTPEAQQANYTLWVMRHDLGLQR